MKNLSLLFAISVLGAACGEVAVDPDGSVTDDAGPTVNGTVTPGDDANPCDGVTCECDDDTDCGSHEFCDLSGPGRVCACVPRYEDTGSGCVWAGAPDDPSFEDTTAWTIIGDAIILPTATGSVAPGQAFFPPAAVCNLSRVSQTVTMPTYEQAEPLAIKVTRRYQGGGMYGNPASVAVAVNDNWLTLDSVNSWDTQTVCLGEAAYGGDIELVLSSAEKGFDCSSNPTTLIDVDHVTIEPDAGCPMPGTVREGDFENGTGWVGSGTAGIANGLGNGGSNAGRVQTSTFCQGATLTGIASFPVASVASPALELWSRGNSGNLLTVSAGSAKLGGIIGTGAATTNRICIPPAAGGWVRDLGLALPYVGGSCAGSNIRDFRFDDLAIVSEPACGNDPYLVDGGFELAAAGTVITPWVPAFVAGRGDVKFLSDAGQARTGTGVLELMVQQQCSTSRVSADVKVPAPNGNNGPAVEFAYNVANNPESTFDFSPGAANLPEGGGWTTQVVCLDPDLAGRTESISFTIDRGSGTCANTFPAEFAYVNDVRLTTSSSCPVN